MDASSSTFVERLKTAPRDVKAGLIYLQVNSDSWPSWLRFLAHSAAANSANVATYFLGPPIEFDLNATCPHACVWLPVNSTDVASRVEQHLGVAASRIRQLSGRKICDLKPLWPSLFPELTSRHEWIGYADTDVLIGDLSSEVERLSSLPDATGGDDLLVPMNFFPHPLANGNFLLMRTSTKMVRAFERSASWKRMLSSMYMGFDEWGTSTPNNGIRKDRSMAGVYQEMLFAGILRARPTLKMLIQDTIVITGRPYPTIDAHAAVINFRWRNGSLEAKRIGPCYCPKDVIPQQMALSACEQCISQPGRLISSVITHRRLEVLALHFQSWKKAFQTGGFWKKGAWIRFASRRNASATVTSVEPTQCVISAEYGFSLGRNGFRCESAATSSAKSLRLPSASPVKHPVKRGRSPRPNGSGRSPRPKRP